MNYNIKSYKFKEIYCPTCFHPLNGLTSIVGKVLPDPGDFSLCVYCKQILRFNSALLFVESSEQELKNNVSNDKYNFIMRMKN